MKGLRVETCIFVSVAVIIAFLVIYPIGMMICGTFLTKQGTLTLANWQNALQTPLLLTALKNTLLVTVSATLLAVLLGLGLAFIVGRTDTPMRNHFQVIAIVPFITPPIIAGLAWQILAEKQSGVLNIILQSLGIPFRLNVMSISGIIFVTALYLTSFVFLITHSVLLSLNPELEEASSVTGAGRFKTFFKITLPLLLPGITSAALLAFMFSNITFGIHVTLGMPVNIWFLTTAIYQSLNVVPIDKNQSAILAFILMFFGVAATYFQIRMLGRRGYTTLTGKGFRPNIISLGKWRWIAWGLCVLYVFVVAILPYVVLFLRSTKPFTFQPGMTFFDVFTGWRFDKYYSILFGEARLVRKSMLHSFFLAIGGAAGILFLTSIAAYILTKTKVWGRQVLNFLCMIPSALPGIVIGVAILWGYTQPTFMLYGTFWILLVAYVTKDLPLGIRSVHACFLQVHPELEESSRVCGATWLRQFFDITLPLVKPGLVVAFVLIFASILREIGASILLYTYGKEVVAYVLFNLWENGEHQMLSAFVMITTFLTMAVVVLILRVTGMKFIDLTHSEVKQS